MQRSVNALRGYQVCARDGTVGWIDHLLFDDRTGNVRFLVVRLGNWLWGRQVLLAPAAARTLIGHLHTLDVALTQAQVEQSPSIEAHPPVCKQRASSYRPGNMSMAGWEMLPGSWLLGVAWYVAPPEPGAADAAAEPYDTHLRSTREIIGYQVQASDGVSGRVVDFVFDESSWALTGVVLDISRWWRGRRIFLPWQQIMGFRWLEATVQVGLPRMSIHQRQTYDPMHS